MDILCIKIKDFKFFSIKNMAIDIKKVRFIYRPLKISIREFLLCLQLFPLEENNIK